MDFLKAICNNFSENITWFVNFIVRIVNILYQNLRNIQRNVPIVTRKVKKEINNFLYNSFIVKITIQVKDILFIKQ